MHKKITVNGDVMIMPIHANLLQLISDDLRYSIKNSDTEIVTNFVVALNAEIKPASQWQGISLNNGDCIDILGAITGG